MLMYNFLYSFTSSQKNTETINESDYLEKVGKITEITGKNPSRKSILCTLFFMSTHAMVFMT